MKKRRPRLRVGDTVEVLPCVTGYRSRYAGKTGKVYGAVRAWWRKRGAQEQIWGWVVDFKQGRRLVSAGFKRHELKLVKRGKK